VLVEEDNQGCRAKRSAKECVDQQVPFFQTNLRPDKIGGRTRMRGGGALWRGAAARPRDRTIDMKSIE